MESLILKANKFKLVLAYLFLKLSFVGFLILGHSPAYGKVQACQQLFQSKPYQSQKVLEEKYAALEETLFIGHVVSYKPFSKNNNRNPIWKLKVRNPKTNQVVEALLKPRPYGDGGGWNRTTMEYVAYRTSLMLNMDYVAPVAYRRNLSFGYQHIFEGSIQLFVQNAKSLHHVQKNNWPEAPDLFLSDARVLDILLQNPDRHKDNFMMGDHWLTGKPTPLLIDQAASLLPGTNLKLSTPGWSLSGPVQTFKRSTYEGLLALNHKKLKSLQEFLTDREISGILSRRDGIVLQINKLMAEHGEEAVLFD